MSSFDRRAGFAARGDTRLARQVTLPAGYHIEYGGQFEAQEESMRTLAVLSLIAIAAIFLILFAEFRSAHAATLVMANLPLALIGGVVAVALTGRVLSIASLVGFVTLALTFTAGANLLCRADQNTAVVFRKNVLRCSTPSPNGTSPRWNAN